MATTLIPIEIGSRWGMLVTLERMPSEGRGKPVKYKFKCDCGSEVVRQSQPIRQGKCTNCGCQRSVSLKKHKFSPGDRYGDWTVIREVELNERAERLERSALSRCVCGTERQVRTASLIAGISDNCGCKTSEKMSAVQAERRDDLTGETFGFLTYIEDAPRVGVQRMSRCMCQCGTEVVCQTYSLINGGTKSCGCYAKTVRRDVIKAKCKNAPPRVDYVGLQFGRYQVTSHSHKQAGRQMWNCKCDGCGQESVASSEALKANRLPHCPCDPFIHYTQK